MGIGFYTASATIDMKAGRAISRRDIGFDTASVSWLLITAVLR